MNRIRIGFYATAFLTALYACGSWATLELRGAGIFGAIAGASFCTAELIGQCQRKRHRRYRNEVWERRDQETKS